MSKTTHRTSHTTVALKLPLSVSALVIHAKGMVKRMTAKPSFPNPRPTLAAVTSAIDDLQAAETAALARTTGAVATRNDKRATLILAAQRDAAPRPPARSRASVRRVRCPMPGCCVHL